ncbi:stage II sporulation protein R [Desulfotomaculum nigrificans CO-1-SRB]|uniref:Stage II sporulation protein R n=1 Tax=Desulfotomaculum nigrificans (strain DSM 14880 / VKM B-2319 / CO-1-SRB) TaxID=868595 RepID=F6B4A9_DESCC|nr:stage II sporulation protein R [Desulfotomaculum nigrificans]AEF95286.1 stage II sporulation protein R [Desulfotomaculum nigrificans CO-1-SRB]
MFKVRHKLLLAAVCGLLLCTGAFFSYKNYVQHEFAGELIRFHVIANSDSYADQALKLHVRDVIVNEMKKRFSQANSRAEAETIVKKSMPDMQRIAEEQIHREGKNYRVAVMMGDYDFPTKTYGNLTLPAGNYHAVRVVIGEGKGKNWWCVLFPPLCFVDSVQSLEKDQRAKGLKVFEKDNVEFRLRSADILRVFS